MAKLTIAGETFEVRPLTLFDLRHVGPAIDRINGQAAERAKRGEGEKASLSETLDAAADLLEVMAAGIDGETGESLAKRASAADLNGLWASYSAVVEEAGFGKRAGEAQPAKAPAKPSRSRSVSAGS